MNSGPATAAPRTRVRSGAWLFSLSLHGALLAAMSLCYFQQARLHDGHPAEVATIDVCFVTEPAAPSDPLAETPPPSNEMPSREWVFSALDTNEPQPEPAVATVLEDEQFKPVQESREAEAVPEMQRVRFDAAVALKRVVSRQNFSGDGGGGSKVGSGGAPAAIAAAGPGASGRGGEGNGTGTGNGSGSGSGNRPGNGSALSGNGAGNGQGDGVGSGTGGRGGGGIATKPPRVKRIAPAVYPREAQLAGHEGVAKVRIEVLESGHIGSVEVVQSSGYDSLDRAACSAARLCSIDPQEEDGRPVACSFTIPYRFTLSYK